MEEQLLVPFRAKYRAIHQAILESKFVYGWFDWVLTGIELRSDQYNHLAGDA